MQQRDIMGKADWSFFSCAICLFLPLKKGRQWHSLDVGFDTTPFLLGKQTSAFSFLLLSRVKGQKKTLLFLDFFQFGTLNFPTNLCNNAVNSLHICTCIFSALFSRHRRFVPLIPNDRKNVTVTVPLEYLFVGGTMYLLD